MTQGLYGGFSRSPMAYRKVFSLFVWNCSHLFCLSITALVAALKLGFRLNVQQLYTMTNGGQSLDSRPSIHAVTSRDLEVMVLCGWRGQSRYRLRKHFFFWWFCSRPDKSRTFYYISLPITIIIVEWLENRLYLTARKSKLVWAESR